MKLFDSLAQAVATERDYLFSSPIIVDALRGNITRAQYVAFLKEAYFHVKETVPLLMACGSRLGDRRDQNGRSRNQTGCQWTASPPGRRRQSVREGLGRHLRGPLFMIRIGE